MKENSEVAIIYPDVYIYMYIYMYIYICIYLISTYKWNCTPNIWGWINIILEKGRWTCSNSLSFWLHFFCTICLSSSQLRSEFWHNWQKCILLILAPFQCSIFYRTAQFPGSILSCVLAIHGERWKTISSTLGTGSKMKFTLRKKNLAIENPTFRHYFPSYKLRFVRGFPSHVWWHLRLEPIISR